MGTSFSYRMGPPRESQKEKGLMGALPPPNPR